MVDLVDTSVYYTLVRVGFIICWEVDAVP